MERLRFFLNDKPVEETGLSPTTTLLRYLRDRVNLSGTKEGCAEGDCGACTVAVLEHDSQGAPALRAVNSCLVLLPMVQGKRVYTVEALKEGGQYHVVQETLARELGSQCGYCTPGIAMAMLEACHRRDMDEPWKLDAQMCGNLCRCTGYRPILEAAEQACCAKQPDQFDAREAETIAQLKAIAPREMAELSDGEKRCLSPLTVAELAEVYAANPDARLLAGGTDLALEVTQFHRELPVMIHVGQITEMKQVQTADRHIEIGAAAPLTDCYAALAAEYPDFGELLQRFASLQIRNQGTLGGNIGNASPIGDSPPLLIALGAEVVLRKGASSRTLPLEDYFIDYKVTARQPGEFIEKVRVPRATPDRLFRAYKVSKRLDDDISAVCAAFDLQITDGVVADARVAFGGMAAIPKRAAACEATLNGAPWNQQTVDAACDALAEDFTPLTDFRASREYRLLVAQNLLRKCFLEQHAPKTETRVTAYV